jgi:hypothetical protein
MTLGHHETKCLVDHQLKQIAYDKHVAAICQAKPLIDTSAPPPNPRLTRWRVRFAQQQKAFPGEATLKREQTAALGNSPDGQENVGGIENACPGLGNKIYDGMTALDPFPPKIVKPLLAPRKSQPKIVRPAPKLRTPQSTRLGAPFLKDLKDEILSEPVKFDGGSESDLPGPEPCSEPHGFGGAPVAPKFQEGEPNATAPQNLPPCGNDEPGSGSGDDPTMDQDDELLNEEAVSSANQAMADDNVPEGTQEGETPQCDQQQVSLQIDQAGNRDHPPPGPGSGIDADEGAQLVEVIALQE